MYINDISQNGPRLLRGKLRDARLTGWAGNGKTEAAGRRRGLEGTARTNAEK